MAPLERALKTASETGQEVFQMCNKVASESENENGASDQVQSLFSTSLISSQKFTLKESPDGLHSGFRSPSILVLFQMKVVQSLYDIPVRSYEESVTSCHL